MGFSNVKVLYLANNFGADCHGLFLPRNQFNLDFGWRQQRVVNQAVMHGSHQSLGLLFSERNRACDVNLKVAQA